MQFEEDELDEIEAKLNALLNKKNLSKNNNNNEQKFQLQLLLKAWALIQQTYSQLKLAKQHTLTYEFLLNTTKLLLSKLHFYNTLPESKVDKVYLSKLLLQIGDLNRYKQLLFKSTNYSTAINFYQSSIETLPSIGQGYNQLGLIYSLKNDNFLATANYLRSIFIESPFATADSNLTRMFKNIVQKQMQGAGDSDEEEEDDFHCDLKTNFIFLVSNLGTMDHNANAKILHILQEKVLLLFKSELKSLNSNESCTFFLILIGLIHFLYLKQNDGSQNVDLTKSFLVSLTKSFLEYNIKVLKNIKIYKNSNEVELKQKLLVTSLESLKVSLRLIFCLKDPNIVKDLEEKFKENLQFISLVLQNKEKDTYRLTSTDKTFHILNNFNTSPPNLLNDDLRLLYFLPISKNEKDPILLQHKQKPIFNLSTSHRLEILFSQVIMLSTSFFPDFDTFKLSNPEKSLYKQIAVSEKSSFPSSDYYKSDLGNAEDSDSDYEEKVVFKSNQSTQSPHFNFEDRQKTLNFTSSPKKNSPHSNPTSEVNGNLNNIAEVDTMSFLGLRSDEEKEDEEMLPHLNPQQLFKNIEKAKTNNLNNLTTSNKPVANYFHGDGVVWQGVSNPFIFNQNQNQISNSNLSFRQDYQQFSFQPNNLGNIGSSSSFVAPHNKTGVQNLGVKNYLLDHTSSNDLGWINTNDNNGFHYNEYEDN
ncbi:hypothetical protein HDU92_004211 [Lobulomyces angularis]|nr:hypothetical protein HDU92_004211 [Lobulomyces angularis]